MTMDMSLGVSLPNEHVNTKQTPKKIFSDEATSNCMRDVQARFVEIS